MNTMLVTGSAGLIGSEVVDYFCQKGWQVHGIDNNMRREFFGDGGDTSRVLDYLAHRHTRYQHHHFDIRNRDAINHFIGELQPDAVVHTAAQPSHDKAAEIPFLDFEVNAVGTLNLLEACRQHAPDTTFVHFSTNKVYGDAPNNVPLVEMETRWEYADERWADGINEDFPIDQSTHSLFGVSKVAADLMVQEYGRYFGMKTCCLRGGCLTGPNHAGVELHGFLNYLIRCNASGKMYRVFGYGGKQVRDNIHSLDVARFIEAFLDAPRVAEVYNLGGGRYNSISIMEAFHKIARLSGKPMKWEYVDQPRVGDHICYMSDLTKIQAHYPRWQLTKSLDDIFEETYRAVMGSGSIH